MNDQDILCNNGNIILVSFMKVLLLVPFKVNQSVEMRWHFSTVICMERLGINCSRYTAFSAELYFP